MSKNTLSQAQTNFPAQPRALDPRALQVSVVIPVFNEAESLPDLESELQTVFADTLKAFEIVFVDDGSTDQTPDILKKIRSSWPRVRVIRWEERKGQTAALAEGFRQSLGEIIVTLDADLQNNPADIPRLLKKLAEGYDVVCGWRRDRKDPTLKTILSRWGNRCQRRLTGLPIHDTACTLRAYRRDCLKDLILSWEGQHRFIPLMLSLQGWRLAEIETRHRPRRYGVSKYSHRRIGKVVGDFFRIMASHRRQLHRKKGLTE